MHVIRSLDKLEMTASLLVYSKDKFVLFFCLCMLITGCEVKLERGNIPLWAGIQLEADTSCPPESWQANQLVQTAYQPVGWTVEIPIYIPKDDTSSIRLPDSSDIQFALAQVSSFSTKSCLHFSLQNPFRIKEDQISFSTYIALVDQILGTLSISPDKLMFSGFWIQKTGFQQALLARFPAWRSNLPQTTLYLAGRHTSLLSDVIDWEGEYELAVIHDAPPDEVYKPYFRKVNQALSKKALEHGRQLFIAQSNLLGDQKMMLFKNQLRFWDEALKIDGLTINSLYCTSSLADSMTRFGLAKDLDLLEYVKNGP